MMLYKNGKISCSDYFFREGAFEVIDGVTRLADGIFACAAINLYDCMVNAICFGIPEADAVRAASYNPACAIGADKLVGSIETGKTADFLVCNADYTQKQVFLAGKQL